MSTTKIRLSITLPGSVMLSQEETCKLQTVTERTESGHVKVKDGKIVTKEVLLPDKHKFHHFELKVMDKGKPEILKIATRKCHRATQVVNICEEAYEEFIKPVPTPYKYKGVWKALTNNQRVQWHCQQIAEAMGGTLDSFVILD